MISLSVKGDDLGAFVLEAARAGDTARDQAVRKIANDTAAELRRIIRRSFGTEWRVWAAKGFASTIRVTQMDRGHYRVYSKARYARGRTGVVDLLWVFDTAPTVRSGFGKKHVAIPIKGQTPIARNGRRYMTPSEAAADGWELYFASIRGRSGQIAFGRRNRLEEFRPLWFMKPQVKEPKRLDLDGLHARHAMRMDEVWAQLLDRRLNRAAGRGLAA